MSLKEEVELAYLAGYFDGEGCIGIYLQGGGTRKRKGKTHILNCTLGTCDKEVPILFYQKFGGSYREVRKNNGSGEKRNYYCWNIVSREAEGFLNIIYPYLVAKKSQASVGLELRKRIKEMGKLGKGRGMNDAEFSLREQLRRIISSLKRRI